MDPHVGSKFSKSNFMSNVVTWPTFAVACTMYLYKARLFLTFKSKINKVSMTGMLSASGTLSKMDVLNLILMALGILTNS